MRNFIKTNFDKNRGSSKVMGIHKKFLHHQLGGSPRHKKGCTLLQSFTHKSNVTVTSARTGPVLPAEKDGASLTSPRKNSSPVFFSSENILNVSREFVWIRVSAEIKKTFSRLENFILRIECFLTWNDKIKVNL